MKSEISNLLICPECKRSFKAISFKEKNKQALDGLLCCDCGKVYPIINSIPRILPNAFSLYPDFTEKYKQQIDDYIEKDYFLKNAVLENLKKKTQESFGYQWTSFSQMSCDFQDNFLNYIYPVNQGFFKGKLGLDAGCGFGRHIYNAAKFGANMVGIDYSRAIESTYFNTRELDNVYLAQADIYNLPFSKDSFDFVYSIGVLHHLPEPELGFQSLVRLVKPKGAVFIWVYSNQRKWTIRILELVRKITTRIPFSVLKFICFLVAFIDYYLLICPFRLLRKNRHIEKYLEQFLFPRICLYWQYPFQVNFADWFDRFSAPVRFYYGSDEIKAWFERVGLRNIIISPTGYYGWRAYGEKD